MSFSRWRWRSSNGFPPGWSPSRPVVAAVESVAWVTQRRDVLCGLFYLLALLVYVRAFPRELCQSIPPKPSCAWAWVGREVRSVWLGKIPFLVIGLADGAVALYFGIRNHLVEPVVALGWADRIAITVYGTAFYLRKTVVPVGLSPLYPFTRL